MMLVSREARITAEKMLYSISYHELSLDPDFDREFLDAVFIPHKDSDRFPTVRRVA